MPKQSESPLFEQLTEMMQLSFDRKWLDDRSIILTRIAALAASDASARSYALNIGAAEDLQVKPEEIRGVLGAIAPIVGSSRIVTAIGHIAKTKALALEEFKELEDSGSLN